MKSTFLTLLCVAAALLVASAATWFWLAPRWRAHQLIGQAGPIQASLETYRHHHHRYPEFLSQIGLAETEEGPLYYQRETESSYILWFGTTLGRSMTFHSTDGRWQ